MKKILNIKNSVLAFTLMVMTMMFGACATGGNEYDLPLDEASATGLCGVKWVMHSVTGGERVEYSAYVFNLDGTGSSYEQVSAEDELKTSGFTWKSYNTSSISGSTAMHMLVIKLNGSKGEMSTYYKVVGNTLRLNNGQGGVFTYMPEDMNAQ